MKEKIIGILKEKQQPVELINSGCYAQAIQEDDFNIIGEEIVKLFDISDVIPRNCGTCAHKKGSDCMLSGYHILAERTYPTKCGIDFKGWRKRLGFIDRVKSWL